MRKDPSENVCVFVREEAGVEGVWSAVWVNCTQDWEEEEEEEEEGAKGRTEREKEPEEKGAEETTDGRRRRLTRIPKPRKKKKCPILQAPGKWNTARISTSCSKPWVRTIYSFFYEDLGVVLMRGPSHNHQSGVDNHTWKADNRRQLWFIWKCLQSWLVLSEQFYDFQILKLLKTLTHHT